MRIILLFLIQWSFLVNLQAQSDWDTFVAVDGGFKINSPVDLELREDTLDTDIGSIVQRTWFGESAENGLVLIINRYEYPDYTIHSDSVELLKEFFQATLEEAILSVDGELLYESEKDYRDFPGRRWRIDYLDGQASLKVQAIVIENQFYSIQIASPSGVEYSEPTSRFLDSFALLTEE
ncbi:MAG: hypothetical protein GYB31_08570 [Bacteroidetes bacterium]|nr:hypothetical protein [Bacteroidota bacterium]